MNRKADFSRQTGQSDWSKTREGQNHCVCLGAYALHSAKDLDTLDLKCDAIPERALTAQYIGKWSTWNNNEKSGQIRHGVRRLVETCRKQAANDAERQHLEELACTLTQDWRSQPKFGADIAAMLGDMELLTSNPGWLRPRPRPRRQPESRAPGRPLPGHIRQVGQPQRRRPPLGVVHPGPS